jgi:pyruvate,water dikinase
LLDLGAALIEGRIRDAYPDPEDARGAVLLGAGADAYDRSARATRDLLAMSELVRGDEDALLLLEAGDMTTLRELSIGAALANWLGRYGMAIPSGMRLEDPTWHEHPSPLMQAVAMRARLDPPMRRGAAPWTDLDVSPEQRQLAELLRRQQQLCDDIRVYRSVVAGAVRRAALAASEHLPGATALGDALLLTFEDHAWAGGDAQKSTIRVRREQYARWLAAPDPPDRFAGTGYPPRVIAVPETVAPVSADDADERELQGIGCSAGSGSGRAVIVHSVEDLAGCVDAVAVCERLPPDWAMLIARCSAVVVARANPLSHAMIVARELGVPAVAGIPELLHRVDAGEVLHVDGTAGVVRIDR